jgi:hypothetical protein
MLLVVGAGTGLFDEAMLGASVLLELVGTMVGSPLEGMGDGVSTVIGDGENIGAENGAKVSSRAR